MICCLIRSSLCLDESTGGGVDRATGAAVSTGGSGLAIFSRNKKSFEPLGAWNSVGRSSSSRLARQTMSSSPLN